MIFPIHSIDYLLSIMNQGNLVHDLSLSNSLLLSLCFDLLEFLTASGEKTLFISDQVELVQDLKTQQVQRYSLWPFLSELEQNKFKANDRLLIKLSSFIFERF